MGLIQYMSRNPVRLAILTSGYHEKFAVTSINAFINNLEMIDNVSFNSSANGKMAPCQLIKKQAENKRIEISTSNPQLREQHFKNSGSGQ